jgi:homoserine kinase type II
MAVLTSITREEASDLLETHGQGRLATLEGIAAGSVNSNFAIVTASGTRLFLRIYEEQDVVGAGNETAMLERIARAGVLTPSPLPRKDGSLVSVVRGKPAALFPWREGTMRCQAAVTADDGRRVGEALARVHLAAGPETTHPGRFRFEDLMRRLERIESSEDAGFRSVAVSLRRELERSHRERDVTLPQGLVHGDLFRDNVLWDKGGRIAALLDFESACEGTYAYDLMVTLLAWCVADDLAPTLARALVCGYESVRPLAEVERQGLWAEGCFAALRFTITRITDYAMRAGADGTRVVKDWRRFAMRFERLRALGSNGLRAALGV